MSEEESLSPFLYIGNALWLDYVNTEIVSEGNRVDLLGSAEALKQWACDSGAAVLFETGATDTWGELFGEAIKFRATLRQLAEELSRGDAPPEALIHSVNNLLATLTPTLTTNTEKWNLELRPSQTLHSRFLGPIAHSAADVLVEGSSGLVRKCEGSDCILFFYDTSKNHKRRWCSMSGCGNRHKAAAHYRRSKGLNPEQ